MRGHPTTALLLVTVLAAGCSGSSPEITSPVAGGSGLSSEQAGSGSAFGSPAASEAGTDAPFNPFADPTAAAPGGRKIIEKPTLAEVMEPGALPEMAQGRVDAPVTIVQYASLTCPHCRHFHETVYPALKRDFIDTGKVRYILREFPIGRQSGNATVALRCAKPQKYFDLYGRFMKEQAAWVSQEVRLEPIFAVASKVGLTQAEWDRCLKDEALIGALKAIKERGRTLGVIGTPNYFVGNQLVKRELTIEDIRSIVAGGGVVAAKSP